MPSDVAAGSAGRGDGDAGLDGDLVGVRSDGDLDGLTGMGQANLDLLAADQARVPAGCGVPSPGLVIVDYQSCPQRPIVCPGQSVSARGLSNGPTSTADKYSNAAARERLREAVTEH